MTLKDSSTIELLSPEFPITFSACVSPVNSCKLNLYTNNNLPVADLNVFTDGLPKSTIIDTNFCADKIQKLCTNVNYPGNLGAGYTTSICATRTFELYNSADTTAPFQTLAEVYPNSSSPATTYS